MKSIKLIIYKIFRLFVKVKPAIDSMRPKLVRDNRVVYWDGRSYATGIKFNESDANLLIVPDESPGFVLIEKKDCVLEGKTGKVSIF